MSKRKYGEYSTFKEARAAAREITRSYSVTPIYEEPDYSYSIKIPIHKKAKFICGIDKSGRKYKLVWTRDYQGKKVQKYEPVKKEGK